jgi:hypothetical protein
MAALGAHVLDVSPGGLGDPQPVQGEEGDEGMLSGRRQCSDLGVMSRSVFAAR